MLFIGDTDEMRETPDGESITDEFEQSPGAVMKHMIGGGVSLPWNMALAALIGLSFVSALRSARFQLGKCPPRDRARLK